MADIDWSKGQITNPNSTVDWDKGEITPPEKPSAIRRLGDAGISVAKGIIGVPEAAVGIADLVTGGQAGKLAESAGFRPKEAKAILSEYYSPQQKAANAEVDQAQGFFPTVGAMLQNPSTIVNSALESAPSIIGVGAISRGLLKVAPRIGAIGAGAAGEGFVAAGQNAEQVRQEDANGLLTGTQSAILAASGMLTGGLSLASGKLANKLGIGDIQTQLAAGKLGTIGAEAGAKAASKGLIRKTAEGFATEGIAQELPQSYQEQVAQNLAQGKPWDEGASKAGAQGMMAGGLMGSGGAVAGHFGEKPMGALEAAASLAKDLPLTQESAQKQADAKSTAEGKPYEVAPHDEVAGRFKTQPLTEAVNAATPGNNVDTPAPSVDAGRAGLDDRLRNDNTGGSAVAAGQEAAPRQNGAPAAIDGTGDVGDQGRTEAVNPIQSAYDLRESTAPHILDTDILDNGKPFATPFSAQKAANELADGSRPYKIAEKTFVLRKPDDAQSAQAQAVETGAVAGTAAEKPAATDTTTGAGVVEAAGLDSQPKEINGTQAAKTVQTTQKGQAQPTTGEVTKASPSADLQAQRKNQQSGQPSIETQALLTGNAPADQSLADNQPSQQAGGATIGGQSNPENSQKIEQSSLGKPVLDSSSQNGTPNANPNQARNAAVPDPNNLPAAAVSAVTGDRRLPADRLKPALQPKPKMVKGVPEAAPLGKGGGNSATQNIAPQATDTPASGTITPENGKSGLQNYIGGLNKLQAGRVSSVLQKQFNTKDGVKTRAEILEGFIKDGAAVKEREYQTPITQKTRAELQSKRDAAFKNRTNAKNADEKSKYKAEHRQLGEQLSSGMMPTRTKELVFPDGTVLNGKVLAEEIKYIEHLTAQNKPTPPGLAKMQAAKAVKDTAGNTPEAIARQIQTTVAANRRAAQEKSRLAYTAKGYAANTTLESEQASYNKEVVEPLLAGNIATAKAILDKDVPALIQRFVNGNFEASEKAFHKITGVKINGLSAANKKAALYKWADFTPEQIAAQEKAITDKQEARSAKFKDDEAQAAVKSAWSDLGRMTVKQPNGDTITGQTFIQDMAAKGFDEVHSTKKGVAVLYGLKNDKTFQPMKHKNFTAFFKAARDMGGLKQALGSLAPSNEIAKMQAAKAVKDTAIPITPPAIRAEQMRQQKIKSDRTANLRKITYNKSPFLGFLGKHGVALSERNEFSPDKNPMLAGFGPMFRNNGLSLDRLMDNAVEEGYLPLGTNDQAALHELISRQLSGEKIDAMYTEDGATNIMQAEIDRRAQFEEDDAFEALSEHTYTTQELDALDGIPWDTPIGASTKETTRQAMQAMGFSEQEIQDAITNEEARARETSQDGGRAGKTETRQSQKSDSAPAREEGLTAPSREDIRAQQDRADNAEALDAKAQIGREAPLQTLTAQTAPDQRNDNTGDMFGQEKAKAELDKKNAGKQTEVNPNQGSMFDEPNEATPTKDTAAFSRSTAENKTIGTLQAQREKEASTYKELKDSDPKAAFEALTRMRELDSQIRDMEQSQSSKVEENYKGEHKAPMHDSGAPLSNLKGVYPDDFYGINGQRYYGIGDGSDVRAMSIVRSLKGRGGTPVTVYRAIPKDVTAKIGKGDWVTIDRQYAKDHGEGALSGDYKIIQKTVRADELFTNGDSIQEWGYDPKSQRNEPVEANKPNTAFSRANPQTDTPAFKESDYRPVIVSWAKDEFGDKIAPNGNPTWQNFVRRFGDSKVVDSEGKPLVVYHGTSADIESFNYDNFGKTDGGWAGKGLYFIDRPNEAYWYAKGEGGNILPVYLSARNPLNWQIGTIAGKEANRKKNELGAEGFSEWVRSQGYDSIHLWSKPDGSYAGESQWIVLDPTQIKSATGNNGNFDATNPDIRYSISKADDAKYADLAKRGDKEAAQQLVDAAAKKAGYNTVVYHAGTVEDKFDQRYAGSGIVGNRAKSYIFFGSDKNAVDFYAEQGTKRQTKKYAINTQGFAEFDGGVPSQNADGAMIDAFESGDDFIGAVTRDIVDGDREMDVYTIPYNEDGSTTNVKSLDPFTYDDSGKLIPLSERFNTQENNIRYSQGSAATGLPTSQVQAITDAIKARWKNAPEIIVAANMDDKAIPQAVRDHNNAQLSQGAQGSPEGFLYGGKVYLVADQLATPTAVMRVLFHETLGHVGLRGTFGDSLKPILQQIAMFRKAEVQAKAKEYGLDMSIEADRLQAAEEVLAVLAQTKPELGFVKRAIAAIRTFLRNHGVKLELSDNDIIANYILPARRFVESGKASNFNGDNLRNSLKAGDWYSELGRQVLANKSSAMPAGMWAGWIESLKTKGVKPDEIEWSGVQDWLKLQSGKVTKADISNYLNQNGVQVQETVLGEGKEKIKYEWDTRYVDLGSLHGDFGTYHIQRGRNKGYELYLNDRLHSDEYRTARSAQVAAEKELPSSGTVDKTKYSQYQLPGGTNYREVLLTLPEKDANDVWRDKLEQKHKPGIQQALADVRKIEDQFGMFSKERDAAQEKGRVLQHAYDVELAETAKQQFKPSIYRSSHWDAPNVLAHIRVNDRTDADGKRVLFVEEIQSDFGADIRKQQIAIEKAIDDDFNGIIDRMKKAGVLEVNCD